MIAAVIIRALRTKQYAGDVSPQHRPPSPSLSAVPSHFHAIIIMMIDNGPGLRQTAPQMRSTIHPDYIRPQSILFRVRD